MTEIVRCPLRGIALASLLLGVGLASPAALAQQRVGVDSAVNPAAMGIPPGGVPRRLVLGQDVVFNERITTEAEGQTQVLFVDESTLSVGPNANMVIDQFVYDPNTGTGKLAASLTRGVFRFVGGKLSKQDNAVTMRTPTATIGIRGGVMLVSLRSDCAASSPRTGAAGCNALSVYKVYGNSVTVTGLNGVVQTITRNGFEVTVSGPGASPSDPAPAPPGATAALLAQLNGRAGGSGGAPIVPTEVMVTNSGIANAISANFAASIQAAGQTQPRADQPQNAATIIQQVVPPTTFQASSVQGGVAIASFVTPVSQVTPTSSVIPVSPVTPISPVTPVTPISPVTPVTPPINIAGVAGGYYDTGNQGATNGFSGSLLPYAGGDVTNGTFSANGPFGPIIFPLTAGSGMLNSLGTGTTSPLGPVTGATYVSPDNTFFFAYLTPVNHTAQREFVYGGTPVNSAFYSSSSTLPSVLAFAVLPDAALPSLIPFLGTQTSGFQAPSGDVSISPLYLATPANNTFATTTASTKALQASLAITGTGAGQSSAIVVLVGNVINASLNSASPPQPIINGVIHGSVLTNAMGQPTRIYLPYVTPADGNGNSFYGANGISGFVVSNGNCCAPGEVASNAFETNTGTQTVTQYQIAPPVISPVPAPAASTGPQTPMQTLTGYFGGIMTKEPGTGPGSPIPYTLAGTTNITTNATNAQVAATLNGTDTLTPSTSGITNGIILGFGSTNTGATNARIAYVNDKLFAAMENPSRSATSYVNGVAVPVTDGNSGSNIYLVTQTAAPLPASFLPGGLCSACTYLQWGYWGGELDTPASTGSAARIDVGHINFWMAGQPTVNMPAGGTGSFTGNAVGSVANGGANYLASGAFTNMYDFGRNTGTVAITGFDGRGVAGTATGSGPAYMASLRGTNLGGSLQGSFYGPTATETGGNFAFQSTAGPSYLAAGIFAGKR